MAKHRIEVAFDSPDGVQDFFESKTVADGASVGSDGATFMLVGYEEHKGFGLETIVGVAANVAAGVASHFIAEWLMRKLGRSAKYVRYKGEVYQVTNSDMTRLADALRKE